MPEIAQAMANGELSVRAAEAKAWVKVMIQAIRDAPGDNPYASQTDDEIAQKILAETEQGSGS